MKNGALTAVADSLRRSISLRREIEKPNDEASWHREYGRLLATTGSWAKTSQEFDTALDLTKAEKYIQT
jgi:hypothetical protein